MDSVVGRSFLGCIKAFPFGNKLLMYFIANGGDHDEWN